MSDFLEVPRERFDYEAHVRANLSCVHSAVLAALRSADGDLDGQKRILRLLEAHKVAYLDSIMSKYGSRSLRSTVDDEVTAGMGPLVARVLKSVPGYHPQRDELLARITDDARLRAEVVAPVDGVDMEFVMDVHEHLKRIQGVVLNLVKYGRRSVKDPVLYSVRAFKANILGNL